MPGKTIQKGGEGRQQSPGEAATTMRLPGRAIKQQQAKTQQKRQFAHPGARASLEQDLLSFDDTLHDDSDEEGILRHDTWHTEVPQKTSRPMPVVSGASARPKF